MDFTQLFNQSASLVSFSPGAQLIVSAFQDRVTVRRANTFEISRTWLVDPSPSPQEQALLISNSKQTSYIPNLPDSWITHLGWSCDSEYILAACAKKGVVHLLKLREEEWHGRIDAGAEGLVKAEGAPDGRTVVCFSDWGLRVSLWSIITGVVTYIQFPIHPDKGYAFRSDGHYFALAERHKSKDTLGVYDASASFRLVRHFPLPTSSFASLSLAPTGNYVAVWDGPLDYKLHVLTLTGEILTSFTPSPDPEFGVRTVAWHPSAMFLAVGGYDNKVHILDSLSWCAVATFELATRLSTNISVWSEPAGWIERSQGCGFISYDRVHAPQILRPSRVDSTKAHPKSGTIQLSWNLNGSRLMIRFENMSTVAYIYDFPPPNEVFLPRLRSALVHSQPILQAKWNPVRKGNLAICCGTQSVYTWSEEWIGELGEEEEMAECIGVPLEGFETRDIRWAPDGKGFLLVGREVFCAAYEVEEESYISHT